MYTCAGVLLILVPILPSCKPLSWHRNNSSERANCELDKTAGPATDADCHAMDDSAIAFGSRSAGTMLGAIADIDGPTKTRATPCNAANVNNKGRVGWLCAWRNSFLLLFANLRRQGWKTRRPRGLYFTNTPIHRNGREKINDIYAVQESFLSPTDRTFLSCSNRCSFSDACRECLALVTLLSFASRSIEQ